MSEANAIRESTGRRALRSLLALLLVATSLLGALTSSPSAAYADVAPMSNANWESVKPRIEGLMGTPYVFGGRSTSGWDCSGFVSYVMHEIYGTEWPGGSWGDSGTDSIAGYCSSHEVYRGSSASDYNDAFDEGVIRPGDIIVFYNSSGGTVHAGLAGESQTVYHAWHEDFGTGNCRFDYMWEINGGHGKVYATFRVYRALATTGDVELVKRSAIPEISGGNPLYSLAGAEYGVFRDKGCTDKAGTIVTDGDGYGKLEKLEVGTYYVKELKASPGYSLDPTVYQVSVESGKLVTTNSDTVPEIPKSDPVGMLVMKADASTGKSSPQGSGTLAGAEFTVSFYVGQYSSAAAAEASGAPARTWVFRTDSDGFAYYSDDYKVAGPELYRMSNGDPTIPLGTIVIQETKAPVGYNLDDGSGGAPKKFCVRIADDGAQGEAVYAYNTPESPDTVKRGDYRLVKEIPLEVEADSGIAQESQRVLLPGIQFQLINASEHAIMSPQTKQEVEPGGIVCTIVTDENGLASTKNGAAINGWSLPAGWTGALAYGTYTVHEVIPASVASKFKADYGYDIIAVDDWKMTISSEGQYDGAILVNNHIPQTPLRIHKVDSETGKQIPLQCSFQLLDSKGELVTYEFHYPDIQVEDIWTANEKGEVMLPMLLEEGDYTITEVQAPYGYVKDFEGKRFHVGAVYNGWDDPIDIEFENTPQKATISVIKHDSATGDAVDGSTYIVAAAADIVTPEGTVRASAGDIVATLVTDEVGHAQTSELYLGTYTVYEAKAKDGFSLDTAEKTVTLEYAGQDISVYDSELEVEDVPTELKVRKVDALNLDVPVAGARFRLWGDDGKRDMEIATDEEGMVDVPYLGRGTYHLQEIGAPEGYVVNDVDEEGNPTIYDIVVNDQGMFELEDGSMRAVLELIIENMPKSMRTMATDAQSGTHEGQAREELTIVDVVEYTGTIPGDEYKISGVLMDKATGKPALDANGDQITSETTFVAEGFEGTVVMTFAFDGTGFANRQLVAFESMEFENVEYMVHTDMDDTNQTVSVVDISTQAANPETGDQTGLTRGALKITDTVKYEGLTPGETYTMSAHLVDSETGGYLLDVKGDAYSTVKEFVPEEEHGEIVMEIVIDASELAGKTTVFFESLADMEGNIIASHEDLGDEGQSIHFPQIHTSAVDGSDGDKNVVASEKAIIVDAVTYENLMPGRTYVLMGTIMDRATGEPLKAVDGSEVLATETFVPEEPDGTAEVVFEFDATGLEGATVVVFEYLVKDGIEVASHADIEDEAQTVKLVESPSVPDGKGYPKTGAVVTAVTTGMGMLTLLAYGLAGGGSALLSSRKKEEETIDEE